MTVEWAEAAWAGRGLMAVLGPPSAVLGIGGSRKGLCLSEDTRSVYALREVCRVTYSCDESTHSERGETGERVPFSVSRLLVKASYDSAGASMDADSLILDIRLLSTSLTALSLLP